MTKDIKIRKPSKREAKKNVELEPTLHESRDQSRVDQLIMAGLGENVDIVKYRHVLQNPKASVTSTQYREAVGDVLDALLEVVFADPTVFQKVRTDLQKRHLDEGVVGDIVKGASKEIAAALLHKHAGVIGKAIALRTVKKAKKKKP